MHYFDAQLLTPAFTELLSYAFVGGAGYLAARFRRDRRSAGPESAEMLDARLQRIDGALEQLDQRIGQSVDAQRFATELMLTRLQRGRLRALQRPTSPLAAGHD